MQWYAHRFALCRARSFCCFALEELHDVRVLPGSLFERGLRKLRSRPVAFQLSNRRLAFRKRDQEQRPVTEVETFIAHRERARIVAVKGHFVLEPLRYALHHRWL